MGDASVSSHFMKRLLGPNLSGRPIMGSHPEDRHCEFREDRPNVRRVTVNKQKKTNDTKEELDSYTVCMCLFVYVMIGKSSLVWFCIVLSILLINKTLLLLVFARILFQFG